ncbi:hypothetical protein SeLEV6574_g03330 [Synchytrium endobioticum]|uniref:Uncharacterized protein n=1 Tax=Synchytrium endobioticum TaxID=286115 RepID=A0A507D4R9_9FUNG|nr:hypothetical protein SeLEV6574_g03330 [Synchytrium endobioticum]
MLMSDIILTFFLTIIDHFPAEETGLPELITCGTYQGNPVNLDCATPKINGDNLGSLTINGGRCMKWATVDDQPGPWCTIKITRAGAGNTTQVGAANNTQGGAAGNDANKIDCLQIVLNVTATLNGTSVPVTLAGRNNPGDGNGNKNNTNQKPAQSNPAQPRATSTISAKPSAATLK